MRSLESAAAIRKANATVKSVKGERKTLFHELLLNEELTKDDLVDRMAVELEDRNFETELSDDEFEKFRVGVNKSVSNFISVSRRPSTAKATYNGDEDYNTAFKLSRKGNLLTITPLEA